MRGCRRGNESIVGRTVRYAAVNHIIGADWRVVRDIRPQDDQLSEGRGGPAGIDIVTEGVRTNALSVVDYRLDRGRQAPGLCGSKSRAFSCARESPVEIEGLGRTDGQLVEVRMSRIEQIVGLLRNDCR